MFSGTGWKRQTARDFPRCRKPPSEYRPRLGAPRLAAARQLFCLPSPRYPRDVLSEVFNKTNLLMLLVPAFTYLPRRLCWPATHVWDCLNNPPPPRKAWWTWVCFHNKRSIDEVIAVDSGARVRPLCLALAVICNVFKVFRRWFQGVLYIIWYKWGGGG